MDLGIGAYHQKIGVVLGGGVGCVRFIPFFMLGKSFVEWGGVEARL